LKDLSTANTAVCIAGAHRSGTSMLTKLLHTCGLYLAQKRFDAAQADNPDAFGKIFAFVALNDEVLMNWACLGSSPKADENFKHARLILCDQSAVAG